MTVGKTVVGCDLDDVGPANGSVESDVPRAVP